MGLHGTLQLGRPMTAHRPLHMFWLADDKPGYTKSNSHFEGGNKPQWKAKFSRCYERVKPQDYSGLLKKSLRAMVTAGEFKDGRINYGGCGNFLYKT